MLRDLNNKFEGLRAEPKASRAFSHMNSVAETALQHKMISGDPRTPFTPEDELPKAELLDDDPMVIINGRLVCPNCGGTGCDECE